MAKSFEVKHGYRCRPGRIHFRLGLPDPGRSRILAITPAQATEIALSLLQAAEAVRAREIQDLRMELSNKQ
jgi:hypothetical protein